MASLSPAGTAEKQIASFPVEEALAFDAPI
jgi:hypothetical protein